MSLPTLKRSASDFFAAFGLPFQAVWIIARSRRLSGFALLSAVVTCAVLVLLLGVLWGGTGPLVGHLWSRPDNAFASALWHLLVAVTFVVLFVVGANTLPLLALAPLQDPISEATEELVGGFTAPAFSVSRVLGTGALALVHTAKRVAILLLGHALLLLLNFVPVAGNTAWSVLSHVWTIWWLTAEYLSGPMSRHYLPFRDVRRAMFAHKAAAFGFGAAVYLVLWIPVVNFFLIPLAIVGGTLLFRALQNAGAIATPTSPSPSRLASGT